MKKLEKMDQVNFLNVVMILAKMNPKCKAYDLHSVKGSFIGVKSADGAKEYESVCIDDLFYNYMSDRIDTSAAADEIVNRVLAAKEKVQEEAEEAPRPQLKDVPTDKIMDIFRRICKDAEEDLDIPTEPEEKPKTPKASAMPKPAPVPSATPAQAARPFQPKADTAYDSMFSALDDDGDEDEESDESGDSQSDSEADVSQPAQPDVSAESAEKAADSAKKSANPQADMGLMDIMSAALGLPEAGSEEAAAAAKAEAEKFDI